MEPQHLPDGRLAIADDICTFTFERLRPGVMLLEVAGWDKGQFGTSVIDQIRAEIDRFGSVTLLMDARRGAATGPEVTDVWKGFFQANQDRLASVTVLVGSRYMEFTVAVTTHLARLGRLVTVTTDVASFDRAIALAKE